MNNYHNISYEIGVIKCSNIIVYDKINSSMILHISYDNYYSLCYMYITKVATDKKSN